MSDSQIKDQTAPPADGEAQDNVGTSFSMNAEMARKALMDRPAFTLRLHIYLGFILAFLCASGIAFALVLSFQRMESSTRFLEIVNDYVVEVEQARRYEKNYFLYGTNLNDSIDSVLRAERILNRNAEELSNIMGGDWREAMLPNLHRYQLLLEQLNELHASDKKSASQALKKHVREQGQLMVSAAQSLLTREKISLSQSLSLSRRILMISLGLLLVLLMVNAYFIGSRMLSAIRRFSEYAHRIAAGDFTPIAPTRSYRDEFTKLALAINSMIAELEQREAILIQSHKMRAVGTLTAGVAHELNNPLNNITLTAHVLQEDYENLDDEERMEMIGDVVSEASRAKNIISNLLDFARESSARIEPLDVPQLLQETINLAANQIKLSGIHIAYQATKNLPKIHGDRQQLRQVFLNLLLNAIDASHKKGTIQVLALPADEPNFVAIKIIDFGKGIPKHILQSIFDPFFTTKERGKGTGLGLSVSEGIIAKHGGRILVDSREGKGTSFTVVLPVTTIPADISAELAQEAGGSFA